MTTEVQFKKLSPSAASLGWVWLLVAVAGGTAFYWDGILSLFKAWSKPEYSHGPLIPLIAGYLLLREIDRSRLERAAGSRTPGLLLVLAGVLVGFLGNLTQIPYFITYGQILAIGGLILVVAGVRHGYRFWVAWAYLIFMLPLPNAMYWQLSTKLQFLSSELGVELIRIFGFPVLLEGNVIDLGDYKLQVAEACSGLRYLFPLASFSFLFAAIYNGPVWHRIILVLSSLPITVAMNSFRIGVIGALVNMYGIEQAEGFLHWFEGWVIFAACLVILYAEAAILQMISRDKRSVFSLLDLQWDGLAGQMKRVFTTDSSWQLATASIVLLVVGLGWQLTPGRTPPVLDRASFQDFPLSINGWNGTSYKLDPVIEATLGADEYLSTSYAKPGTETVSFFVAYYNSTTDGSGIHSPEICIPGGGWEVSRWQRKEVSIDGNGKKETFMVNRAIIQKGELRQVVYYWFQMRGTRYASEYTAKLSTIWNSLTRFRADGALVRLVTPIGADESEAAADQRLVDFVTPILADLNKYVPD